MGAERLCICHTIVFLTGLFVVCALLARGALRDVVDALSRSINVKSILASGSSSSDVLCISGLIAVALSCVGADEKMLDTLELDEDDVKAADTGTAGGGWRKLILSCRIPGVKNEESSSCLVEFNGWMFANTLYWIRLAVLST